MHRSEGDLRTALGRQALWPLLGGLAGMVFLAVLFATSSHLMRTEIIRAYLVGYVLWFALSLGGLGMGLLQAATAGEWGLPLIRIFASMGGVRHWILLAIGYLPIAVSLPLIYSWTTNQDGYLNPAFFIGRTYAYLIVLALLAGKLRNSATGHPARPGFGAIGLVLVFLVGTFISFDWLMSLTPDWTSTIYGLLFVITCGLGAMSFAVGFVRAIRRCSPFDRLISPSLTRDWGNLMLTLLMLWAYFNYSQYIVIWSGDIKGEVPFYVARSAGGWNALTVVLIVFGFIGPLLALTSPTVKASIALLGNLAHVLVWAAWLTLFWMTGPSLSSSRTPLLIWLVAVAFVGVGGIWKWAFLSSMRSRELVPHEDERIRRVLDHATA